jgi:hypothetical protein
MKKLFTIALGLLISASILPISVSAAAGIYASGGGSKTVGQTFTVSVVASGTTFNALEGTISVSGPVSITSFSAGGATWLTAPANGVHFKGMVAGGTSLLTVATIKLKATGTGSGAVSIGSVRLANAGAEVGSGAGSASYTIAAAPNLPSGPTVLSETHPDQNQSYEETTIKLSWEKASKVDGFSYLLDQTADTAPPAKTISADTTVSYENQAIGVYYFHIRAHNADGWGGTTHFKINIKEPEPKVDQNLDKPSEIEVAKADNFFNNVNDGTVTGVIVKGKVTAGFDALIKLTPAPNAPDGTEWKTTSDLVTGNFEYLIDFPIPSGYYKLIVQGQKEKVLTPESDLVRFEISQKYGGSIDSITDEDAKTPVTPIVKGSLLQKRYPLMYYLIATLILAVLTLVIIEFTKYIKRRRNPHLQ